VRERREACANVANLMLTRAAARQRELAIRTAIGAGRGRIVRQLLTEAAVLGLVAGVAALPLSILGMRLLDRGIPPENPVPYYMHWSLDVRSLLYTGAISLVAAMFFGLAPALHASSGHVYEALKEGGRGMSGGRRNRLRNTLVVMEVALSLVLLVGASLFWRSFAALEQRQTGFDTAPILTMRFYLPGTRYDSATARAQRVQDIMTRVEQLPGVEAATVSNLIPLDGGCCSNPIEIEGQPAERGREPVIRWTSAAGYWFPTFSLRMISGRDLADHEVRDTTATVAVINQAMSKRFWPKGTAVGSRFRMMGSDSSRRWITVVGVAPDMYSNQLDDNQGVIGPTAYLPFHFLQARNHGLMVRTSSSPAAVAGAVRSAIRASDPALPVFSIRTMDKVRELGDWQYELFGWMFGMFGAIALLLAAIGVYGVISYGVSQRTQEIGVRVALGARRGHAIGMVVRNGMRLSAAGLALGLLGAVAVTRVVQSILIGVSPTDPLSFGAVTVFLGGVAFVASYVPARRATTVDPIIALRFE
jgi:putative ABC transport system permease protein